MRIERIPGNVSFEIGNFDNLSVLSSLDVTLRIMRGLLIIGTRRTLSRNTRSNGNKQTVFGNGLVRDDWIVRVGTIGFETVICSSNLKWTLGTRCTGTRRRRTNTVTK